YHSSATARDRDRLRQEVLEGLGWRICRVWSTDWLRDRQGQVRRVRAALEQAGRQATPPPRPLPPPPQPQGASVPARPAALTAPAPPSYQSIDEVPEFVLRELVCLSLRNFGATEAGDLIQAVARQLGFRRTGKRIEARIEQSLEGLIDAGQI